MGTHSELLSRTERTKMENRVNELYPPLFQKRFQIQGHYIVGLSENDGMAKLKDKLLDIALHHPKIGIGKVLVPETFVQLKHSLDNVRQNQRPFISWMEYSYLALSIRM